MYSKFYVYLYVHKFFHGHAYFKVVVILILSYFQLYAQYDDDQIGELDSDEGEIDGLIPPESQRVMQMLEEYETNLELEQ